MKFTATLAVATMAVVALAAPTEVERRTGGGDSGDTCVNNEKQVCCNGILSCAVQVLGAGCNGGVFCCETAAPVVRTLLLAFNGIVLMTSSYLGFSHQHLAAELPVPLEGRLVPSTAV